MIPKLIEKNKKLIVGIGSALVDILSSEDNEFLKKTGAVKGGMTYVDKDYIALGTEIDVKIRDRLHKAKVCKWPFVKIGTKSEMKPGLMK